MPPLLHMPSWRAQGCMYPLKLLSLIYDKDHKVAEAGISNFLTPKA